MKVIRHNYPPSPPPNSEPIYTDILHDTGKNHIDAYLFSLTYMWLNDGTSMWVFPTGKDIDSVFCYVWQDNEWVYRDIDLVSIDAFF